MMDHTPSLQDLLNSSRMNVKDIVTLMDENVIKTVGKSPNESEWVFTADSLAKVKCLDNLCSMGYRLSDAVRIVKNIGTPEGDTGIPAEKLTKRKVLYTPGELARLFHVSPRAVKYWEEKLLIKPYYRSKSGIRFYHKKTKIEIVLLKSFQSLGFSLDRIKVFLELYNFILEDDPVKKKDRNKTGFYLENLDELDAKLLEFENSIQWLKKLSGKGRKKLGLMRKKS